MRNMFVKVVYIGGLLCSCHEQRPEKIISKKNTESSNRLPYNDSANITTENSFQESVDSLQRLWMGSERVVYLKKLEAIALESDGEKSEYMDVTLVDMLKSNPVPLVAYLNKNKKSALYGTLTDGLSAELCVYSRDERVAKKNQIKENATKMSNGKLTQSELEFMDQLFRDVVPEKFD